MWMRRLLGWQAREHDRRIQHRTVPLVGLHPSKIVLFTSYALAEFTLPSSSFFLTLLGNYDLQLHHMMSHAIVLVAIFVHLCEMYVGVRSSVLLFQLFFVSRASRRSSSHLRAYYF
jgi:hypothetical protein